MKKLIAWLDWMMEGLALFEAPEILLAKARAKAEED